MDKVVLLAKPFLALLQLQPLRFEVLKLAQWEPFLALLQRLSLGL